MIFKHRYTTGDQRSEPVECDPAQGVSIMSLKVSIIGQKLNRAVIPLHSAVRNEGNSSERLLVQENVTDSILKLFDCKFANSTAYNARNEVVLATRRMIQDSLKTMLGQSISPADLENRFGSYKKADFLAMKIVVVVSSTQPFSGSSSYQTKDKRTIYTRTMSICRCLGSEAKTIATDIINYTLGKDVALLVPKNLNFFVKPVKTSDGKSTVAKIVPSYSKTDKIIPDDVKPLVEDIQAAAKQNGDDFETHTNGLDALTEMLGMIGK